MEARPWTSALSQGQTHHSAMRSSAMSKQVVSQLVNKVALVTGGSRGIGAAIAKRLAADGATVAITYAKDADAASAIVKAIERDGGKAIAIQADAADVEAVKGAVEKTVATFGRLDVRFRNGRAGIVHQHIKSAESRDGLLDRTLDCFDVGSVRLDRDGLSAA